MRNKVEVFRFSLFCFEVGMFMLPRLQTPEVKQFFYLGLLTTETIDMHHCIWQKSSPCFLLGEGAWGCVKTQACMYTQYWRLNSMSAKHRFYH
jgi:hypothetical protein